MARRTSRRDSYRVLKGILGVQVAFVAVLVLVLAIAQILGASLAFYDVLAVFGGAVLVELAAFGLAELIERFDLAGKVWRAQQEAKRVANTVSSKVKVPHASATDEEHISNGASATSVDEGEYVEGAAPSSAENGSKSMSGAKTAKASKAAKDVKPDEGTEDAKDES